MPYDLNHLVTTGELKQAAEVFKLESDKAIKSLSVSGNTISFFTSEDGSGTAAATIDFPTELFLDQSKTKFENSFEFTAAKYPGAVNPSLDGQPVLVLAVKGTTDATSGTASDTVAYSFLDMSKLVDTYEAKEGDSKKILNISGYEIEFKISAQANNAVKVKDDGLYVDISGKTDKVVPSATGNIPSLDADGNLADSGVLAENVIQKSDIATEAEIKEMLDGVFKKSGD